MSDYENNNNNGFEPERTDTPENGQSSGEYSLRKDQVPYGTYGDGGRPQWEASRASEQENRENSGQAQETNDYDSRRNDAPSQVYGESRGYVDANYRTRQEDSGFTYGTYYTPPKSPKRKKEKVKKEKKPGSFGFLKVACMCLVCALLGGIGGGALVASRIPEDSHVSGSLNVSSQPVATPEIKTVADGSVLTGSQIYALGCEQVVGVTTEISYRNYFGMEYSYPISGSGFIVTENGYVVTNYHVVADAYKGGYKITVLLYNGDSYDAEIVGVREEYDLAVLKIDATNLSAATIGDSNTLKVGDAAYAIGNPLGELNFTMTSGHISALDRSITTTDQETGSTTTNTMFQLDAAINQGNSGGPVYNDKGEVVGIVTAKYADTGVEGLGFAIPISNVIDLIDQFVEVGYVSGMPSFGIMLGKDVDSATASYFNMAVGAYVQEVTEGSCSEKAGMKAGDIITEVDGTEITGREDLANIKKNYRAGDTVTVKVFRNGEEIELSITFDEEEVTITKSQTKGDSLPVVPKK